LFDRAALIRHSRYEKSMNPFLLYEQQHAVVTLTMNEPQTRNALTGNSAVDEFVDACQRINADASVRVVIVTGSGPVFSAGGNVKDMRRFFEQDIDPVRIREEYRNGIQRLPLALYNLEVPTIAAVNGAAIGAGCDLTCMCDIRIASDTATFAESFVKVGIIPGDGGAWLLPRVVGLSKAAEMSFTGEALSAAEALECGLVSRVVPPSELLLEANRLARRIAANPGHSLRMTKRLLREGQHARLESLLELSAGFQALAHKTPQHKEAVMAFIEKRKPVFDDE
jgi:enoyl-CoA hydratase/carnithine racemase